MHEVLQKSKTIVKAREPSPLLQSNESNPLAVLLVDDEAPFVEMVARELTEEHGYKTTVAMSGAGAVDLLQQDSGRFNVILLDYDMPGMDGLQFLQWLRQRDIETPVIVLTGAGSEAVAVQAMKLGAYDYVRKEQIDLPHLAHLVRATHERRLFRIARAIEEERTRETGLTVEATERMRDVVGAITQTVNGAFAAIATEVTTARKRTEQSLSDAQRQSVEKLFYDLHRQVDVLETGVTGILKLYRLVYAHHGGKEEIQQIKQDFLDKVSGLEGKQTQGNNQSLR